MNTFKAVGLGLVGFGTILATFSYFVILSVPLTAIGLSFCVLGCVVLIFPEYLVPHQVVKGMISGSVANIEALLEEFTAVEKAIYLPAKEGKVYVFCPLSANPSYPEINKITDVPKRIISSVNGHPGLFIYPPGSDVVATSGIIEEEKEEVENKGLSLENFLPRLENVIGYLLVDFSEFTSKVQVNFEKNKVFLRAKNIKFNIDAPRFTRVLGSPAASLAACAICQLSKMPVKILEEKREGKWIKAVFEIKEKING